MRSCTAYLPKSFSYTVKEIIFTLTFFFLLPFVAFGASLSFSPVSGTYQVGTTINVGIIVGSSDSALNAISGVVSFPNELLEVTSISKNQSIISLWVQEPSFSNETGTINFEGIVLNPGYIGTGGRVLNVTFRVKAEGSSKLAFNDGSILANDGEGSEILSSKGVATYQIIPRVTLEPEPTPEVGPEEESFNNNRTSLPIVSSASHQVGEWSNMTTGAFNFAFTDDIKALRLLLDDKPKSIPVVVYAPPIASRTIESLEEGISYLHVQYKNSKGWGEVLHYELKIDTKVPESFTIEEVATSTFLFVASDSGSGISHYEVQIDGGEIYQFTDEGNHIYRAPELIVGTHTLFVKAFDTAGNFATSSINFVTSAIPVVIPAVTENESTNKISLPDNIFLHNGTILITVLSVVIPCLGLILLLGVLLFMSWRAVGGLRRRIDKEVFEARMIIHNAFTLLLSDLEEDIETLKKANIKRKLTREEAKILKRLQKNLTEAEKVISKEVDDIKI